MSNADLIVLDTETTGLIDNEAFPLAYQPRIIELGALRVSPEGPHERYSQLVNPGAPLSPIITKITGLTDQSLVGQPSFAEVLPEFREFCLGARMWVAHNARFDWLMLQFELRRLGQEFLFPWPLVLFDTLTVWPHKLEAWAQNKFGDDWGTQKHRAIEDCELLWRCWKE